MTREEIKEGLRDIIRQDMRGESHHRLTLDAWAEDLTCQAIDYLHSKGLVIKVDRELPEYYYTPIPMGNGGINIRNVIGSGMRKAVKDAGFVAVKPLIEERKNDKGKKGR